MENNVQEVFQQLFKTPYKTSTYKGLLRQRKVHDLRMTYELLLQSDFHDDMNKTELINEIYNEFPIMLDILLENVHSEFLDYIFEIVDHDGELLYTDETPFRAVSMFAYLIAFPVLKDGQFKLVMPNELVSYFKQLNRKEIYEFVEENDVIITYARSLVNYYGLLPIELLCDYLQKQQGIEVEEDDIHLLLNIDGLFIAYYDVYQGYLIHGIIGENQELQDIVVNSEQDYYRFSKDQILSPQLNERYVKASEKLMNYLQLKYGIPKEEGDYLFQLIENLLDFEQSADSIIDMMEMMFETRANNNYDKLYELFSNLIMYKRKWSLRGHTEYEISNQNKNDKMIKFPKK